MPNRVTTELKRLAALHDTERLLGMTWPDLAAELENIANRYLDLSDWLTESRKTTPGQVEQERVAVVRTRSALVQS